MYCFEVEGESNLIIGMASKIYTGIFALKYVFKRQL